MNKKNKIEALRKKAEKVLKDKGSNAEIQSYKEDVNQLLEELSIYRIELELQNQELAESRELLEIEKKRFEDLYYNAPVGYFLFNEKGIIVELNHKGAEILAKEPRFCKNKPLLPYLDNENADIFFQHIASVYKNKENNTNELVIKSIKGKKKYLRLTSNLFQNKYCRTLVEDISNEKKHLLKIEQLNNRLEGSMMAGSMAWWELELPSGNIVFNENKALMLGRNPKDFKHYTDFMKLVHPDDYEPTMEVFRQHMKGEKELYECQYRILNSENEYLWFHDVGKVIYTKGKLTKLTGIVTNITERVKARVLIEKQNKDLKEVNATKDKFFNIIAHDLKSPFTTILGFSGLLNKNIEKYDTKKLSLFVNNINTSAERAFKLVKNLLEWARAQQGKIPFSPQKIALHQIAYETEFLLKHQAAEKSLIIKNFVPESLTLTADTEMIKTIFRNLVSNAIKYSKDGGEIIFEAKENDKNIQFAISDNGIGMTEKTKNSLFKIGETESTEGTKGERGTGFGLMICKEFAEKHGGSIKVESEVNKGSKFIVNLPKQ